MPNITKYLNKKNGEMDGIKEQPKNLYIKHVR